MLESNVVKLILPYICVLNNTVNIILVLNMETPKTPSKTAVPIFFKFQIFIALKYTYGMWSPAFVWKAKLKISWDLKENQ